MRKKRVWRYYCDFCNKAACRPLVKHEEHCTKNPQRRCRMCVWAKLQTKSVHELVAAANAGIDTLRRVAHGCPACMLAGIRQGTASCEFDFGAERDAFWETLKAKWEADVAYAVMYQ